MALGELRDRAVLILAHDWRQVDEGRRLPAEELIEQDMLRRRGDELGAADDMGDAHQMVVDDVGKIVGRHAVPLDEDLILERVVADGDVAVNHIVEGRRAAERHLLADDKRLALREVLVDDFLRQIAAGAVVADKALVVFRRLLMCFAGIAEAAIGEAVVDELLRIFGIDVHALALDVGAAVAADVRAFVRNDVGRVKRAVDEVDSIGHEARAVGILNAQDEVPLLGLGVKIGVERRSEISNMHIPCRAWGKTSAYFFCIQCISPPYLVTTSSILQILRLDKHSRCIFGAWRQVFE